jgi:hypothetical protein
MVMKCETVALAATVGTLTTFWQDSGILAKLVSILVSTAALASSTHCVSTHWKWSQLPDLDCVRYSATGRILVFPSEHKHYLPLPLHYSFITPSLLSLTVSLTVAA